MNIYANRFILELSTPNDSNWQFETVSYQEAAASIRQKEPLFGGQVYYVKVRQEPLLPETAEIFSLLTESFREDRHAKLVLQFETQKQLEQYRDALGTSFKQVQAAGGIVRNEADAILMIFRNGLWDLPKGHVEANEGIRAAALREVEEETGLTTLEIQSFMETTWHMFPQKGKWVLKATAWYHMKGEEEGELSPQVEEGITEVRWVPDLELRNQLPETWLTIRHLLEETLHKYPAQSEAEPGH